jgi:hypothetical protein
MDKRRVEFIAPTERAFEGMKHILFRPFDMGKWFLLGFTAWLSTLLEGGGSGGSMNSKETASDGQTESFSETRDSAIAWMQEHLTLILSVSALVLVLVLAVVVVFLWLQSRGNFMFLDNVLNNRAMVSEPWRQFRGKGNSLFRWRLIYGIIVSLAVIVLLALGAALVWPMIRDEAFDPSSIPWLIVLALAFTAEILVVSYIGIMLANFVIPLMHRYEVTASQAWRMFLALHASRPGSFVLFFFWTILITLGTAVAIMVFVLLTCCIAAIPLIIPYLGTVLLLPVHVFMRLIGPEFLKQFGSEFDTLVTRPTPPPLQGGGPSPSGHL